MHCSRRITGLNLTVEEVRKYRATVQPISGTHAPVPAQAADAPHAAPSEHDPRVLSFAELKELIEQGKTDQIPNNRVIPEEVSVSPSTEQPLVRL